MQSDARHTGRRIREMKVDDIGHNWSEEPDHAGTVDQWADRINTAWNKSRDAVFETGGLLVRAKASVSHGEWMQLVGDDKAKGKIAFGYRAANMLMVVVNDEKLSNVHNYAILPASYNALYELTKTTDEQFQTLMDEGVITPEARFTDIKNAVGIMRRADKHSGITDNAKPTDAGIGPFSLIYADPPWTFSTYSEVGKNISPEEHYPCSSDQEIIDVKIGDHPLTDLIADDAVLFLWCTSSNFPRALDIMHGWGFEYVTHAVWDKQRTGTGYWLLNQHEPLIIAKRGKMIRPLKMFSSVASYPRGEHSAKPPEIRTMIEEMYPGIGEDHRLEMYARGEIKGWSVFGNQGEAACL